MTDLVERLRIVDSPDYGKNIHLTVRREDVSEAATALEAKEAEIAALRERVKELELNPSPQDYLKTSRMWAEEKARAEAIGYARAQADIRDALGVKP